MPSIRTGVTASIRLRTRSACAAAALSLLASAGGLFAPAARAAGSGGNGLGGNGDPTAPAETQTSVAANPPTGPTTATSTTPASSEPIGPSTTQVATLTGAQQVTGDGITFTVAAFGELNHAISITGEAPPTDVGATIEIEGSWGPSTSAWTDLVSATVGADGDFTAIWTPEANAVFNLQATLIPGPGAATSENGQQTGGGGLPAPSAAASALTATTTFSLPVFKMSTATLYGPGLWGHRTACGQVLRRTTLGVANRTLPCGTMISVYFHGREVSVPVIDRGPYANNASWDLTAATARALNMTKTSQVGTVALTPATALTGAVRSAR